MKLRIGAYDRVSLEEQADGYSLDAQKAALKEYCEKKGYELVDVYSDEGESAKDFERPEVQRLFRDLLIHDKLDAILVWKVDRLSRNNSDVLSLIDKELKPRNKRILVSTCDIDSSTPVGYMFISLLSTFAQYERETIIDRVHLGMDKRAESGHWNGGIVYGYDCVDGALVVNEVEKKIVNDIFKLRSEGHGYKKIAVTMNELGYKTKKNNLFTIAGIRDILKNEVYVGNTKWKKKITKGFHKAIIDMRLWNEVLRVNKNQKEEYGSI